MHRWMSHSALELAERLLTFGPSQRITAEEALNHEYFTNDLPDPIAPEYVPLRLPLIRGKKPDADSRLQLDKPRRRMARTRVET